MTVIGIIVFLFSMITFPYTYYMDRALVERDLDTIGQEWILAHKEIRSGKIFTSVPLTHASTLIVFASWAGDIEKYSFTGSIQDLLPLSPEKLSHLKKERPIIDFDSSIRIQSWTWIAQDSNIKVLYYVIRAPYANGFFSTGSSWYEDTTVSLQFGFDGGSPENGRIRSIYLRPYLK